MLRPSRLVNLIGQETIKRELSIRLESCRRRNDVFMHTIISSPGGTGKTTLAHIIANELNAPLKEFNGASIIAPKDLLKAVMNLERKDVLFIDEIHRINVRVQEFLYPVMEDFKLPLEDKSTIIVPKFTLVGATTDLGRLSQPLISRFVVKLALSKYTYEDLAKLARTNAAKLGISGSSDAFLEIARRCKYMPRNLNNLLRWIKDVCTVQGTSIIDRPFVNQCLFTIGIDANGLNQDDRRYLQLLAEMNKPVGVATISAALNIDQVTVENMIEPFLLEQKLILKTPKGRIINEVTPNIT